MAPRLRIGAVGASGLGDSFTAALARAGHTVRALDIHSATAPEEIARVDAIVLTSGETAHIAELAERLAPHVRPRQMVIHTALMEGTQLLDAVETRGAIVMAAHNIFANHWVTSAADELGETVISLLVAEIGGISHPIADNQRLQVAAALRIKAHESVLRGDSFELLSGAVDTLQAFGAEYSAAERGRLDPLTPAELDRMHCAIEDPGIARLFLDLQRRSAQHFGDAEAELWSMFATEDWDEKES